MPKRRRLLPSPMKKNKLTNAPILEDTNDLLEKLQSTPRSRLRGALQDVLEPSHDDSDTSAEHTHTPAKRDRTARSSSEDEEPTKQSLPRQSYVLKLFDRSVDLSQFEEDSPLYPICRAWITNQPKANYKSFGKREREPTPSAESVDLPPPTGPPVSKIPQLLPEQKERNRDNINLDYQIARPPSRETLLSDHLTRWYGIRTAWNKQALAVEERYKDTQKVLNKINVNVM